MEAIVVSLLGSSIVSSVVVGLLLQSHKRFIDQSIEQLKGAIQVDIARSSAWHAKRTEAFERIYVAFGEYLDFLRRMLYFESRESMDPMWHFNKILQDNTLYLDAVSAAKISLYRGELLSFWNEAVGCRGDPTSMERVRSRLDYEIPGYLARLQVDMNAALDPRYDPSADKARNALIQFYFAEDKAPQLSRASLRGGTPFDTSAFGHSEAQ